MVDSTDRIEQDAEGATATQADRRRPGRSQRVSPQLVPLLRGKIDPNLQDPEPEDDEPDQVRGVRGLAAGLAISAGLWAAIVYAVRWLLF